MTTAALLLLAYLGSGLLQAQAQTYLNAVVAVEMKKAEGKPAYYTAVNGDVVSQLRLTDEDVLAACRNISGETTRVTAHPYTCSAFLTCLEYNGPNYGVVFIRPLSAGLFWSADNTNERAVPEATCSRNPCRTGRPITDAQNCFSYITCENNPSPSLKTNKCENGTSFSYTQGAINPSNPCVSDNTCFQYPSPTSRVISCIPNGDVQRGVTNYNKTQELTFYDGRMEITTLNLTCPADTVLDVNDLANCTCVPSNNRMCPLVLEQHPASIRFDPANTILVEIPALASNEIAGNFNLSFSFQASGSVAAAALVSNARDTRNCQTATIEVYLDNNRVVASLRTVNSTTSVTLTSNTLPTGSTVTVLLTRNGNTAILIVNNNTPVTADIGPARLAKTNCGLTLGRGYPRPAFQGLIENLRMTLPCA